MNPILYSIHFLYNIIFMNFVMILNFTILYVILFIHILEKTFFFLYLGHFQQFFINVIYFLFMG